MKSFHSSRLSLSGGSSSSHDTGRGLVQSFTPADPPIREESKEVITRATSKSQSPNQRQSSSVDDEEEYVIHNLIVDHETREDVAATDAEKTVTEAGVPDSDAAEPMQKQDGVDEPVKPVETSVVADHGLAASQATVSTEFSRQFAFVDDVEESGGVQMHSAWSLEEMKREKSRVDAVLVETLRGSADDGQQLDEEEQDAVTTAETLNQAADELSNYAMQTASRSVGDELPLSETTVRAAAAVTVNLLNRAIRDELRQLPSIDLGFKCGQCQIKWAAIVVGRLLRAASGRKLSLYRQPPWTEKSLDAAVLLVNDVLSMAITYINHGPDVDLPKSAHVWTESAIRATCRIILNVMDEALQHASTATARSMSERHPTQRISQPAIADAHNAEKELQALEGESSARLDPIGLQPSSLGLEPSDLIVLDSSYNISATANGAEAATNDNANNAAAGHRGSDSLLGQLFGRRRRHL